MSRGTRQNPHGERADPALCKRSTAGNVPIDTGNEARHEVLGRIPAGNVPIDAICKESTLGNAPIPMGNEACHEVLGRVPAGNDPIPRENEASENCQHLSV
jgi:hypothetical protein